MVSRMRDNIEFLKEMLIPTQESDLNLLVAIEEEIKTLEKQAELISDRITNREDAITSLMRVECSDFCVDPTNFNLEEIKSFIKDK